MRRGIFLVLGGVIAAACGGFSGTGGETSSADSGADGSVNSVSGGGGGEDGGSGGLTDAPITPIESGAAPPPVTEPTTGIFVSNTGDDTNGDGSMATPYLTLGHATQMAIAMGKPVLACNQTYNEQLTMPPGVSLYANYDCTNAWAIATTNGKLMSPASPAVIVTNASTPTLISHLDIIAPDAVFPERSSLGVLAVGSSALTLASLAITAGNAIGGVDGVEPTPLVDDNATPNTCGGADPTLYGGAGGAGQGAQTWQCMDMNWILKTAGTPAQPGSGPAPVAGTNGSSSTGGVFTKASGFVPGDGTAGTNGTPGIGGAGGGSPVPASPCPGANTTTEPRGGTGGPGGCPGLAGPSGTGGGASIAIVAISSPMLLSNVSLTAKTAGNGGKGTGGSAPAPGEEGDPRSGNPGQPPGISGSGAGGHSVCIAETADGLITPASINCTYGNYGTGVAAFTSVDGQRTVPASSAGVAQNTLTITAQ